MTMMVDVSNDGDIEDYSDGKDDEDFHGDDDDDIRDESHNAMNVDYQTSRRRVMNKKNDKFTSRAVTNRLVEDAKLLNEIDVSSTMELHRSNLMKMQTQELLSECQITDLSTRKWAGDAQVYLQKLTAVIRIIEIGSASNNHDVSSQASDKMTGGKKKKGRNIKLVIGGSYRDRADKVVNIDSGLSSSSKLNLSVEPIGCTHSNIGWMKKSGNAQVPPTFTLMCLLPQEIFGSKDYLHYRYFDKRDYVMDQVAKFLARHHSDDLGAVEYVWPKGMHRPPVLQLIPPSTKGSTKFQVHLHFGMKTVKWIPPIRLVPNRSNLRHDDSTLGSGINNDDSDLVQRFKSQAYNQSLLYDARHEFEDTHLSALVDNHNTLATLALIQIWALQRGLWRNHDGWSQENVAIFLLYLIRTNRMNARMTPIQQLTVAMQFWATTNWLGEHNVDQSQLDGVRASQSESSQFARTNKRNGRRTVLVLPFEGMKEKDAVRESDIAGLYERQTKESPLTDSDPPTLLEAYSCTSQYSLGPVMLDPTMRYNYLGDVSPNYMKLLQLHARKGLEALKASRSAFRSLFMDSARFWTQWDLYVKIRVPEATEDDWELTTRSLVRKLEMALGNRINGIRLLSTGNGDVQLKKESADEIPTEVVSHTLTYIRRRSQSPTGSNEVVLGIAVNPETSCRVVDRGPPSDQAKAVKKFVQLWGERKAQLRRFKDGAIVQAVVWNDDDSTLTYQNCERVQGGYIGKIVRHIVGLHYTKEPVEFSLPHILSVVDGIRTNDEMSNSSSTDPFAAHQHVMKAYESLVDSLRRQSQSSSPENSSGASSLGLPLPIDAVEPLSPCLRYSELFPPTSHPFLGGSASHSKRISGVLLSDPILIQIRFGATSKWPADLKAIASAKAAMLVQIANGIDSMNDRKFVVPALVTPNYLDIGYCGYCFRILIRADPEIKILEGLVQPSPEAVTLLKDLTRAHIISAKHHSMIHAVHTLHPSAAFVVRIAKRWCASHLLSGLVSTQVIELVVARVYSDGNSPIGVPSTLLAGFMGFLRLLGGHDWAGDPFIVDPRGHISDDDIDLINEHFEKIRGGSKQLGPPMYMIAPYDKVDYEFETTNQGAVRNAVDLQRTSLWSPNTISPELVVLNRVVALAQRSHQYLINQLSSFGGTLMTDWCAIFQESPQSFHSYDVLFRINPDLVVDHRSSSTARDLNPMPKQDETNGRTEQELQSCYTQSMVVRNEGPKDLRKKAYRNLVATIVKGQGNDGEGTILPAWNPVRSVVESLRANFGRYALFFYNDLAPEVIGLVWRPNTFDTSAFSAMTAEYARPVQEQEDWTNDTLVCRSIMDLLRDMSPYFQDVITNVKIVQGHSNPSPGKKQRRQT